MGPGEVSRFDLKMDSNGELNLVSKDGRTIVLTGFILDGD
jgi:hypothetical protein